METCADHPKVGHVHPPRDVVEGLGEFGRGWEWLEVVVEEVEWVLGMER